MNDTPLTAKAKIACGFQAVPQSFLEHAEKLERENENLEMSLRNWIDKCAAQAIRLGDLERENAALREDKERLDWIAKNRSVSVTERPLGVTPDSLRAAIDAARKEAQPWGNDPIMRRHLSEGGTPA